MTRRSWTAVLLAVTAATASAHPGDAIAPWPAQWSFEPAVITGLFVSAALYLAGSRTWLRRRGMSPRIRHTALWFWFGWLLLVIALVSPVHPLGQVLFSVHMIQHELLMVAAAPLLVLGRPGRVWTAALPSTVRNGVVKPIHRGLHVHACWLRHPFTAWLLHALTLWLWHVPSWFQATLTSEWLHALQHGCFLGTALWFWQAVFHGPARQAGYGLAVVFLFTTAIHTGALGALITFATTVWYPAYTATTIAAGRSALEDQQLGGLIMWIPAGLTYLIAALALVAGWMRESEAHRPASRVNLSA